MSRGNIRAMRTNELLLEPLAYLAPARAIEGLTPDQAEQRIAGANHSIAEIVAHLTFWQAWFCERCEGKAAPMVARAADGWPAVAPGSWRDIEQLFLAGLHRAASYDSGRLDASIAPPIEFPPLADYTVRDAQIHMATHNAHHLGQIILLRQILGLWPPPAGSWTW
jgi:uncharacterized damage-inducible protein DinB